MPPVTSYLATFPDEADGGKKRGTLPEGEVQWQRMSGDDSKSPISLVFNEEEVVDEVRDNARGIFNNLAYPWKPNHMQTAIDRARFNTTARNLFAKAVLAATTTKADEQLMGGEPEIEGQAAALKTLGMHDLNALIAQMGLRQVAEPWWTATDSRSLGCRQRGGPGRRSVPAVHQGTFRSW